MRERKFILEVQWFHIFRETHKNITILPYKTDFSGSVYISVPNITDEDLVIMKLKHPNFRYEET